MTVTADERRLGALLRVLAAVFLASALFHLFGHVLDAFEEFLREPSFVIGGAAGAVLLVGLALLASGDPRGRAGLVWVLVATLLGTAGAMAVLLAAGPVARSTPLGPWDLRTNAVLWAGLGANLALAALVAVYAVRAAGARRAQRGLTPERRRPPEGRGLQLSPVDAPLRVALIILAGALALGAVAVTLAPLQPITRAFAGRPLFVAHTAGFLAGAALTAAYAAIDLRNRLPIVGIVIAACTVAGLAHMVAMLGMGEAVTPIGGSVVPFRTILTAGGAGFMAVAAGLALLTSASFRRRFQSRFLSATEYRTLIALADILVVGPDEAVPPDRIARNVDESLSVIRARRRWVHRAVLFSLQLHPVLYLNAPFSELDEENRIAHLKQHFYHDVVMRLAPEWWRAIVQAMIRVAKQLTYVGYYSDPDSFTSIRYEPFEERPRFAELRRAGLIPDRARIFPLKVDTPAVLDATHAEADVCVVGSGAAGAVLAHRLAEAGLSVIVLERGQFVPPPTFSQDEVQMMGRLYADGVFQQTQDFRFTILQASCVGGTSVVNNAVSFAPPPEVLETWNHPGGLRAGLDLADLDRSVRAVRDWLPIRSQGEGPENPHGRLNPSYGKFLDGVRALGGANLEVAPVDANIRTGETGCFGCGYCNIGCAYGRKLSVLETVLPWGQARFGADRFRIVAECPVERLESVAEGSSRSVTRVVARLSDGRRFTVHARKVVIAAGTVASSYLLMRSGVDRALPVGKFVSFNMGSALTAEFDDDLMAYDGLQISHYARPTQPRGWVMETWWNPPVAQAINMPGWFEQHYHNMRRYRHLMAAGVLVGTERNAEVRRAFTGGPDVAYVPTPGDLRKLADGLMELGRIMFAGGARRVMINGWHYYEFTSPHQLYELPSIVLDPSEVALGTGHPQGGNAISQDPTLGVVGPDFRVHGWKNLYVCDASVFPTSLTVNPQLTVMALAHYAGPRIAAG